MVFNFSNSRFKRVQNRTIFLNYEARSETVNTCIFTCRVSLQHECFSRIHMCKYSITYEYIQQENFQTDIEYTKKDDNIIRGRSVSITLFIVISAIFSKHKLAPRLFFIFLLLLPPDFDELCTILLHYK